jgi:release factor glutamine methyltransferase
MPAAEVPANGVLVARLRAAGCVFAEDEAALLSAAATSAEDLARMADQRVRGMPLEHVVGWAEFCGLRIAVDPGVFIPRRRTEFLVIEAVSLAAGHGSDERPAVLVDLCCGAAAIGVAVAVALAGTGLVSPELHFADLDPAAVACAMRNVPAGSAVYQGDLYEPLPDSLRGRVSLLLANVPYVPTAELSLLPAEARLHELPMALDGGADGLDLLRRVAAEARRWLAPGGYLLSETSQRQAAAAAAVLASARLTATVATSAEFGATVVIGQRP